jgi:hypothetical protein
MQVNVGAFAYLCIEAINVEVNNGSFVVWHTMWKGARDRMVPNHV